jgi:small conductance mechanosensitive channel
MNELKTILQNLLTGVGLSEAVAGFLVTIIAVILWIVVGVLVNSIVKRSIKRFLKKKDYESRTTTIGKLITSIARYTVWFIIVLTVLGEFNVNIAPILASAGVLGLAIGFGAQTIVKDFISGFFIIFDKVFNVGDLVEIQGFTGNIKALGLRVTVIQNWKGDVKTVSNGDISSVINYSKNNSTAVVEFGVAYETDLQKLNEIMQSFVKVEYDKYPDIVEEPKFLGVIALADSSINMRLIAKTLTLKHYQIERDLRKDLVEYFKENGITIPFPQIVVTNA